jgi:uncharacterized repeat protein (TIGR04042 family)
MPEIFFRTRWPDGTTMRCYSPSLVVEDYFDAGSAYSVQEFVRRSREALTIGSDRVRAKYGFGCANAMAQLELIETKAGEPASTGPGEPLVVVEGFDR